jgi:cytochrome oxidase Cu insertion factor (SCO1/SenC/PrrC family)
MCGARRSVAIVCLVWLMVAKPAFAHRFGGPNDPCERKIGASLIHITLYQPEFDPDAEYCDDIPRAGNTVFVLDTLGDDLRRVPIGVQIFAVDRSASQQPIVSLPPAVYPRGVVDTQVDLAGGRRYMVRVSITPERANIPTVYSFPIQVRTWYRALVLPLLMVFGVLTLVAISVLRYRLSPKMPRRVAMIVLALCVFAAGCSAPEHDGATLPDVRLIDHHGTPVALSSFRGKLVLLDFVHIGCPGVCDNLTNKFGQIADAIRPQLGSKVILVTVTNDPEHDGPKQLLKLARDMKADINGWYFLTGSAQDVARITDAFGVDNRRLPDGSPNHITRVFMLGPDLRQQREYAGMAMNSRAVASEIMKQVKPGGA